MSVVIWSSALESGIMEIDERHRSFVGFINELECPSANSPSELDRILDAIIDCSTYQFAFEEALLEGEGWHDLAAHRRAHEGFLVEMMRLRREMPMGLLDAASLKAKLLRWLFDHIVCMDMVALNSLGASK